MPIEVVNTRNVPATSFPPGIRVSSNMGMLFLSGVTARPIDLDTKESFEFPEDIDVQTRMMLENIQAVLDEAGITWREVVKITRFYTELGGREVVNEYLQGWHPCTTTLGVDRLPLDGAKIMYDVVAVAP